MGTRGRQSAADLSVVAKSNVISIQRPRAPSELTDEQASEWREVVDAMPADWFPRGTHGTLIQLCRHRIRARRIAQLIESAQGSDEFDVKEYRDLLRTEGENTRIIESCETKLRLTPQTRYDKSKKRGSQITKPWEG